jgi:phosphopantothenoylcysteine decarboxylase/phosphopantothenate--cysteine ligase
VTGRRILLGVAGGIAAYKAAALTSRLVQAGHDVDVVLTRAARRFVTPLTFAALTGRRVHTSLWDDAQAIAHITLVRENDVLVIVPATANVIARLALGLADDLLTTAALAARIPIVVAPAMNSAMLEAPATQSHLATLRARGVTVVEPGAGFLAEREYGPGRLAGEDQIVAAIEAALRRTRELVGERVLITAGPTREPIDPVRFLSNASTGTTGIELAREALARGAMVELILGPTLVPPPASADIVRVTTAREMRDATLARVPAATIVIATAAVADWRPADVFEHKVKKSDAPQSISLERNPDILAELGAQRHSAFVVGFAAETDDVEVTARAKLVSKGLDAIAVNDVRSGAAFGTGANALTLLWGASGRRDLGHAEKRELAARFWDALVPLRPNGA